MKPLDYKEKLELSQLVEDDSSLFYYTLDKMNVFYTDSVESVSSSYSKKNREIKLLLNKEYWDSISVIEKRFILNHQCLHVILEHYGRASKMSKVNPELLDVAMDLVVNHFLVNKFDFQRLDLTGQYYWVDEVFGGAPPEFTKLIVEKYKSKMVPTTLSLEEYYELLVKMQELTPDQGEGEGSEGSEGQGKGKSQKGKGESPESGDPGEDSSEEEPGQDKGEKKKGGKSKHIDDLDSEDPGESDGGAEGDSEPGGESDSGDGNGDEEPGEDDDSKSSGDHDFDQDEVSKQIMESIARDLEKKSSLQEIKDISEKLKTFGKGSPGDPLLPGYLQKIIDQKIQKMKKKKKWESIITKWDVYSESENEEYQFVHEDRRFACVDRSLDFPQKAEIISRKPDKLNLMFFLDCSGSCHHLADRFFAAAKSLDPKKFNVRLFSRTTEVHELFPNKNGEYKVSGYGSDDFSCIERFIQDEIKSGKLKKYPEGIFHVTDGFDCSNQMVKPQIPQNWHWFLPEDSTKDRIPKGCKIYQLKDFE